MEFDRYVPVLVDKIWPFLLSAYCHYCLEGPDAKDIVQDLQHDVQYK